MKNQTTKNSSVFKHFHLSKTERTNRAEEPKDLSTWIKHGVSELLGTILLSLFLAGLSTQVTDSKVIENFLMHPIIVGFYAGFIAVGTVLVIFLRWSCDLNPMVTITRILKGTNTYRYGAYKIVIQFIGGIIAGLMIYAVGHVGEHVIGGARVSNHAIDAISASKKVMLDAGNGSVAAGGTWIFFIEMVMGSILLFPIFSPNIKDKYRDLLICFVISMSVWMGILGGTAAINPARGLAQQVPGLFFDEGASTSTESLLVATFTMMLGNIMAPVFYITVQGMTSKWFNPWFTAMIVFKNFRSNNMRVDAQANLVHDPKPNLDKVNKKHRPE